MNLSFHCKEALRNLFSAKLTSFLALLGILVGTASVVALLSLGELATEHALLQFKTLGTNLIGLSLSDKSGGLSSNPALAVSAEGLAALQRELPNIELIAPYTDNYSATHFNGKTLQASTLGITDAFTKVTKAALAHGRLISFLDKDSYFTVIGSGVAKSMRKEGIKNPIGQQILVGDHYFTVMGILKPWPVNLFIYNDLNQALLVPIHTTFLISKYSAIRNVLFKVQQDTPFSSFVPQLQKKVQDLYPNQQLFFRTPDQIIHLISAEQNTFTRLLAMIGAISLVVGGIGVMNIMLVSVAERRREIGIRMAIGARRKDIRWMFLVEAITLTVLGGILGLTIGLLITWGVSHIAHWEYHLLMLPLALGFFVSVLIGIVAGFYPAFRASQLNPIECLTIT